MELKNIVGAIAAFVVMGMSPLAAATLTFESTLSGDQEVPPVSTPAFGSATLTVDDMAETLSFSLDVTGIFLDDLNANLVAAAVGPVHLHNNVAGANGPIVVPFAFNSTDYQNTADGFSLNVVDLAFADLNAIAGGAGTRTFTEFLGGDGSGIPGLLGGGYYINIHTEDFAGGQLRGQIPPVPLPAGGLLLITGMGGLALMRRRKTPA